eukprot:m.143257 g.143257  ORF g.143257 m.143257 type:complete len:197 (-) comp14983_c0_seq4:188-778(-)
MSFSYTFKLILVGDAGVGKSSLLMRFADKRCVPTTQTIGVDFKCRQVDLGDKKVNAEIWDTAGSEFFAPMTRTYYRQAAGVIVAFDLTSRRTFENLGKWMREAAQACPAAAVVIVACKSDMTATRSVGHGEAVAFAESHRALYYEVSSLVGTNVDSVFEGLCIAIIDRVNAGRIKPDSTNGIKLEGHPAQSQAQCC